MQMAAALSYYFVLSLFIRRVVIKCYQIRFAMLILKETVSAEGIESGNERKFN